MAKYKTSRRLAQGNDLNGILFEPRSDWTPPTTFPDLSHAKEICIDVETRDPNLTSKGPGSLRKDGYPVGFSIATDDGFSGYYPTRHLAGGNLEESSVLSWLRKELSRPEQHKVGANIPYDLEWLHSVGVHIKGRCHDIQGAESLIDEEKYNYGLEYLAKEYLGEGKDEEKLREAAREFHVDPKGELWKLHSRFVGPYGEADTVKTLRIHQLQKSRLADQGLGQVHALECDLIPIILQMRIRGVKVDLERAAELSKKWKAQEEEIEYRLLMEHGKIINPWSQDDLCAIYSKLGLGIARTEAGNPSFTSDVLAHSPHPFSKAILELRRINRLRSVYVDELIFGNQIAGRIHCQFHPLRKDDSGTRSGRFSSSDPNLQQVPARDSELAPLIRSLFIPEDGHDWAKLDYSQQEPRILVHYSYICGLQGAAEARDAYVRDPLMDYYKFTGEVAGLVRRDAKTVTLGRFYTMGKDKLANDLNRTLEEAAEILRKYDAHNPYVQKISEKCISQASKRGYIKTLYGRKCHFDFWIPSSKRYDKMIKPVKTREAAEKAFPNQSLERAFTYKALNRLIQGSAGDMTKLAMVHNYKEHRAVPHLQVHDELDYSVADRAEAERLKHGMENCVKLEVPIVAELDYGKHWK